MSCFSSGRQLLMDAFANVGRVDVISNETYNKILYIRF